MMIKKIVTSSLAVLSLLVISGILLLYSQLLTIDLSSYRQFIDSKISTLLGQSFRINGAIQLQLSFKPTIQISNIDIINPKKLSETQLFNIPSILLSFDLAQLSYENWKRLISMTPVIPADIHINFIDANFSAHGTLIYHDVLENIDMDFELSGQHFKSINFFSDESLDNTGPFQLRGKINLNQNRGTP